MKRLIFSCSLAVHFTILAQRPSVDDWPVLKHYDQAHLAKIVLPVGGIGTGTVNLGGIGDLRQWEIMNIPAKQNPGGPNRHDLESISAVFCIYAKPADGKSITKALMGPIEYFQYEAMMGQPVENHGLPRFRKASFDAAYPFGQVNLSDRDMPVDVKIRAYNPLIPGHADDSGIPIAVLRYVVTNKTDKPTTVSVCGVMDNFIGIDGSRQHSDWKGEQVLFGASKNKNEIREEGKLKGIYMYSESADKADPAWGTIALTTDSNDRVTFKTSVSPLGWGSEILSFWDDFSADGMLTDAKYDQPDKPVGAVAASFEIPAKGTKEINFYVTWHFPNRFGWSKTRVGNYYAAQYSDAWDVIKRTHPRLPELEKRTKQFVNAFIASDFPEPIKEAALFNVSTLRTQTVFRAEDGIMFGWEGVHDRAGSCFGSCTHVWNYEQATAFLFGSLSKTLRHVEFGVSTDEQGMMSFRANLPLTEKPWGKAAADGQMGAIMKMYRDWQLSGDGEFLKKYWSRTKKAMEFSWIKNGWDGDRDGVMEGCHHNTMDVDYFGPEPQAQLWYLGALRAEEEMAKYAGDKEFAKKCRSLYEYGSAWTDKNLFNGEYYIQLIKPPMKEENINPLLMVGQKSRDYAHPDFQLGNGCLIDQLAGQFMAHVCDLGYLVKRENIAAALKSIMKYNYRPDMWNHFNHYRSYVFYDESALLMAAYPFDRPEYPFPYFNEVMTGFEYTAAIGMLYEKQTENGVLCIKNIRDRFDGRKRNPFDEIECGHHYARAMISWAGILAWSGFRYSAVEKSMTFTAKPGKYFWSNGYAWGTCEITRDNATLAVLFNRLTLKSFKTDEGSVVKFKKEAVINEGESKTIEFKKR